VLVVVVSEAQAARPRSCPAETNATAVHASGVSCALASAAIVTYEDSTLGCTSSSWCVQSGADAAGAPLFVDCHRSHLRVSCGVYVRDRLGTTVNPRLHGSVLAGRYRSGTVRFTMRHSPYGCPANPVCRR
jgi:hypothetical protein